MKDGMSSKTSFSFRRIRWLALWAVFAGASLLPVLLGFPVYAIVFSALLAGGLMAAGNEWYVQHELRKHAERSLEILAEDQRKALEQQSHMREFLQRALDALPTALFVKNTDNRYVMVNRAFNNLLGRESKEILGRKTGDLFPGNLTEFIDNGPSQNAEGFPPQTEEHEESFIDGYGQRRQILVRKNLVRDADDQWVVVGTLSDITTLRRAEARWQFALEGAGDGLWDWNIASGHVFYSPRWKEMLGYAEQDIGDRLDERNWRIHPEDAETVERTLHAHLNRETPLFISEYRIRNKAGDYIWVLDRGQVMERDDDGKPLRMISTFSNISQRKIIEEELRLHRNRLQEMVQEQTADLLRAKSEAEEANLAKTTFLRNISHELRTPMHAILSFARLGLDRAPDLPVAKIQDYFERIRQGGERLMILLNDLLDLAKLEAGRMDLNLEHVQFRLAILEIAQEFEAAMSAKQLSIQSNMDQEGVVLGDPIRLSQVIRNLISNAIKFSPEGGKLTLSLITTELLVASDGEMEIKMPAMEFRIADEGIGIPCEELDTIFESFVQSSKTKSSAGGTGLGLAICREIVMAHGGTIHANNLSHGAEFIVCIPSPLR